MLALVSSMLVLASVKSLMLVSSMLVLAIIFWLAVVLAMVFWLAVVLAMVFLLDLATVSMLEKEINYFEQIELRFVD